jgi:hypothetical protein
MMPPDHRELTHERWSDVLDAMADPLRSADALALPDDLGPLPAELVQRAAAILEQQLTAMELLAEQRDQVADELASLSRSRGPRTNGPRSVGAERVSTFGATL